MENKTNNLEQIARVDNWKGLIEAIRNNSKIVETKDRCINPTCRLDFLSPSGLIDRMYEEIENALKDSKTERIIGEYACKRSESIASKYNKFYTGRKEEYIDHSLEAESSGQPITRLHGWG